MLVNELDTPAVIVDLDVMERNLSRMGEYCRKHGLSLRPHAKTHKIPALAHKQIESGAVGITVAKLDEAEIMIESGIRDVLVAYPIATERKAQRLANLAERVRVAVSLDSEEAAKAVSRQANERGVKIGILVELDVGFGRCGVPDEQHALALAQKIVALPGLEFRGLMFFPGHMQVLPEQQETMRKPINALLSRTLAAFESARIPVAVVSGGSTPTACLAHEFTGVNEIRPGVYIFNDRNNLGLGVVEVQDCALSVVATVVSTAVSGKAIIDGGSKTFSSDRYFAGDGKGFGLIKGDERAQLEAMSEEHGNLNISQSSIRYRPGDRVEVIPNHVCSIINMHDEIYGVRAGSVETVWAVAARGALR
jgi:D-serine deaminase-like pyridoxal phosphate-dependent protein